MIKKEYVAGSLLEYIQIIKEQRLDNYLSRGENDQYSQIHAAAFRENDSLDIQAMVDEFQSYIGNSLTEMQRQHFLAFSQHYGLPTNLLDFTYSPLVSLYFACSGHPEKDGFVYFLDGRRKIDITGHLNLVKPGLLNRLITAELETEVLYEKITNVLCQNSQYVAEFLRGIDHMAGRLPGNERIHREIGVALHKIRHRGTYEIDDLDPVIRVMDRQRPFAGDLEPEIRVKDLGSFGHLFCRALSYVLLIRDPKIQMEFPFYFTYEPANITPRVSNQSSILSYQLYGICSVKQAIMPDFKVRIQNKGDILEDLDHMGINEKFIFNDYDHIASYIRRKHLKKAKETEKNLQNLQEMADCLSKKE